MDLHGRTALVVGDRNSVTDALAGALVRWGAAVTSAVAHEHVGARELPGLATVGVDLDDEDQLLGAIDLAHDGGQLDVLVYSHLDPASMQPAPFASLEEAEWERAVEAPIRSWISTCRAARPAMGAGSAALLIGPTASLIGLGSHVALCAAAEGQRLFAKSIARTWGPDLITVNTMVADLARLLPDGFAGDVPPTPSFNKAALSPAAEGTLDVVDTAAFLLDDGRRHVTGTTVCLDGAALMIP